MEDYILDEKLLKDIQDATYVNNNSNNDNNNNVNDNSNYVDFNNNNLKNPLPTIKSQTEEEDEEEDNEIKDCPIPTKPIKNFSSKISEKINFNNKNNNNLVSPNNNKNNNNNTDKIYQKLYYDYTNLISNYEKLLKENDVLRII